MKIIATGGTKFWTTQYLCTDIFIIYVKKKKKKEKKPKVKAFNWELV